MRPTKALVVAASLLVTTACVREPPPAAEPLPIARLAPTDATASADASASASATGPSAVVATTLTGAKDGEAIVVRGRPSTVVWQHMIAGVAGKRHAYFDLGGGHEQIVVYWAAAPTCSGDVELTGKVLVIRGASKRPGQRDSKVDDTTSEHHVDVDTARCVDGRAPNGP